MAVLTPDDSVNRVEIDIEFRTFADDGLILYTGGDGAGGNQGLESYKLQTVYFVAGQTIYVYTSGCFAVGSIMYKRVGSAVSSSFQVFT